jgi:hypothetical protein
VSIPSTILANKTTNFFFLNDSYLQRKTKTKFFENKNPKRKGVWALLVTEVVLSNLLFFLNLQSERRMELGLTALSSSQAQGILDKIRKLLWPQGTFPQFYNSNNDFSGPPSFPGAAVSSEIHVTFCVGPNSSCLLHATLFSFPLFSQHDSLHISFKNSLVLVLVM